MRKSRTGTIQLKRRWISRFLLTCSVALMLLALFLAVSFKDLTTGGSLILSVIILTALIFWIKSGKGVATLEQVLDLTRKVKDVGH